MSPKDECVERETYTQTVRTAQMKFDIWTRVFEASIGRFVTEEQQEPTGDPTNPKRWADASAKLADAAVAEWTKRAEMTIADVERAHREFHDKVDASSTTTSH